MRFVYEKLTISRTRERLKEFREVVKFMDKNTLDSITENMFKSSEIHFNELITIKSGFSISDGGSQSSGNYSEIDHYVFQREYRIEFIQEVIHAIFELKDVEEHLFQVMIYRYVYGYTVQTIADMMTRDERVIRRWSRSAELKLSVPLKTVEYI